ncbi:MAG TPA: hypothetical protein VMG58_06820 [Candidatus Sulfotelmatobacter sp.]|nr:hypothetical protein [Candidatus Sulfotelmatobacter sp.]
MAGLQPTKQVNVILGTPLGGRGALLRPDAQSQSGIARRRIDTANGL